MQQRAFPAQRSLHLHDLFVPDRLSTVTFLEDLLSRIERQFGARELGQVYQVDEGLTTNDQPRHLIGRINIAVMDPVRSPIAERHPNSASRMAEQRISFDETVCGHLPLSSVSRSLDIDYHTMERSPQNPKRSLDKETRCRVLWTL